ncbi:MAG: protein kinase [Pyrinomonadaceae bacterium]|nr:protein kinase [Pyrinomonadaceae bacterium]
MLLEEGFDLGKYKIEKPLGSGGMGEVYRANDTELDRKVAIKFLSSEFGSDEKLRTRFIQEVRSVSALNHPHILTVYEFGELEREGEHLHYFVSEFVEGKTLRSYLEQEKLILGDILDVVFQITSALVSAHEAKIVHRDIKPENIMLRSDGYVKILDFGLAKPIENDSAIDLEAKTKVLTNPGTVMGTVNYMSPEQAKGEAVDARTDLWSLGVLFYEVLTGKLPFEGETTSHTIVSILEKSPRPLIDFVQPVPESIQNVIDELLVKDRDRRCQSARDLLEKLKRIKRQIDVEAELDRSVQPNILRTTDDAILDSQRPSMTASALRTTADVDASDDSGVSSAEFLFNKVKRNKSGAIGAAILSLIIIAGISFAAYNLAGRASGEVGENKQPIKLTKLTNNGQSFSPSLSPDGKNVAFIYQKSGKVSLRLRQVGTNSFIDLIPEIKGVFLNTTFSPDGNYIFYVAGESGKVLKSLYKISVLGGEPKKLFDDVDSTVSFSPDGRQLVFLRIEPKVKKKRLIVANADGTGQETIIERDFENTIRSPEWSPDGKTIAFVFYGKDEKGYFVHVDSYDVQTKEEGRITVDRWRNILDLKWQQDSGSLLIAARDFASVPASPHQIWKVPFPKGKAVRVTNDLNNYQVLTIDNDSQTLIAQISNFSLSIWIAAEKSLSESRQISSESLTSHSIDWLGDGKILHTSNESGNNDLWTLNLDGDKKDQLTSDEAFESHASATRDGKYIVYETNRNIGWSIWRMNADGSNQKELLGNIGQSSPQVTNDSSSIVYSKMGNSLWIMSIDGGEPKKLIDDRILSHRVSPDGSQVAYASRPDDIEAPMQLKFISVKDGKPMGTLENFSGGIRTFDWSHDGKAIDFINVEDDTPGLWRISIGGGKPKKLADLDGDRISGFDWSGDGSKIAFARGKAISDLVRIENF